MHIVKSTLLAILAFLAVPLGSRAQVPEFADEPKAFQELDAAIPGKSPAEVRAAAIARFGPAQRDFGSGPSMAQAQWDISQGVLTDIADAPKAIQELAAGIQGKSPAEVRAAIIARFGPAQRDIGSGLSIEQWDTSQGVLTLNAGMGPTFSDPKEKKLFRLLRTTNLVHANLLQSYDMATLHDPANNGMSYGLGTLRFDADMTYRFEDSGQHRDQRGAQAENFFLRHPEGKVAVRYAASISPDTLLEKVTEGAVIAYLTFTSADGKTQATFAVTSSGRVRRLRFWGDKALPFVLDAWWKNFWR